MISAEEWRFIDGYNGAYAISNYGRVKSHKKKGASRIMKLFLANTGYHTVSLSLAGCRKKHSIHRLVAAAFLENPDNCPEVNHKNEVKTDNNVSNLEWCTTQYNINYGTGRQRAVARRYHFTANSKSYRKRVVQLSPDGKIINVWAGIRMAAKGTNLDPSAICRVCQGQHYTTGNFGWRYLEEE